MTLQAVRTFQETTPGIPVGLLVQKGFDYSFFLAQIPNPDIVHVKFYNTHMDWNPTQVICIKSFSLFIFILLKFYLTLV